MSKPSQLPISIHMRLFYLSKTLMYGFSFLFAAAILHQHQCE